MRAETIVVDSGIAVKWFVLEANSPQANLIYEDYQSGSLEFTAPDFITAEVGNNLWKKHIFQSLIREEMEFAALRFRQVGFAVIPIADLFNTTLQIAVNNKRSFYDSLYLALAKRESSRFVTADEKLYNAVRGDFANIVLLASWK